MRKHAWPTPDHSECHSWRGPELTQAWTLYLERLSIWSLPIARIDHSFLVIHWAHLHASTIPILNAILSVVSVEQIPEYSVPEYSRNTATLGMNKVFTWLFHKLNMAICLTNSECHWPIKPSWRGPCWHKHESFMSIHMVLPIYPSHLVTQSPSYQSLSVKSLSPVEVKYVVLVVYFPNVFVYGKCTFSSRNEWLEIDGHGTYSWKRILKRQHTFQK